MTDNVLAEILVFLADFLGIKASADTDLVERGMDSLQANELATFLEMRFGLEIADVSADDLRTPAKAAARVRVFFPD